MLFPYTRVMYMCRCICLSDMMKTKELIMKIILIISLTLLAIAGACGEFEKDKKIAELEKK